MRAFARDTGGAIAVMTALVMPVLIGVAAYAIDASLLLYRQERLQVATDIGAQAGADLLRRGESETAAKAFAEAMVAANAGGGTGPWLRIKAEILEPGQVKVDAELDVERIFSQIFGSDAFVVRASDTVIFEPEDVPVTCLYLDEPGGTKTLDMGDDSTLTMSGCEIEIASRHPLAVNLDRGSNLEADCITIVGRIDHRSRGQAITTVCPDPLTDATLPPAPIVAAPTGPDRGTCAVTRGSTSDFIQPGGEHAGMAFCWFDKEWKIQRNTVGDAGLYFIADKLTVEERRTLELGPGAVIVLMDGAAIDLKPRSSLKIVAPTTGHFADIAIIGDDKRPRGEDLKFDVGLVDISGWLMLPGDKFEIEGTNTNAGCMRILAGTLKVKDKTQLTIRCDPPRE